MAGFSQGLCHASIQSCENSTLQLVEGGRGAGQLDARRRRALGHSPRCTRRARMYRCSKATGTTALMTANGRWISASSSNPWPHLLERTYCTERLAGGLQSALLPAGFAAGAARPPGHQPVAEAAARRQIGGGRPGGAASWQCEAAWALSHYFSLAAGFCRRTCLARAGRRGRRSRRGGRRRRRRRDANAEPCGQLGRGFGRGRRG